MFRRFLSLAILTALLSSALTSSFVWRATATAPSFWQAVLTGVQRVLTPAQPVAPAGLTASAPPAAAFLSSGLVISQVYGGGGNTSAPYTHDSTPINTPFPTALQVNLKEGANNLPGATLTFAGPGSGASLNPASGTATTDASGNASRSVTANGVSGMYSIMATTGALSQSFSLTNQAGAATHFSVSAPSSATAGTAFNFTVTALDAANATATGYTGTVHFTSTDVGAALPANTTLTNGVGTFSATLNTAGTKTITATDTLMSSINGVSGNISVSLATCPSTFTVDDLGDAPDALPGDGVCSDGTSDELCTLRGAVMEVNALAAACSPLTINFSVTSTITLGSALPALAHPNLTITGPGANLLTISGANLYRVLNIASGDVTVEKLTLANGRVTSSPVQGAGIYNLSSGTVTIRNCTIANNTAAAPSGGSSGGGIHHRGGTLNVLNSTLIGNTASSTGASATSTGGGLFVSEQSTGPVNVTNSTIVNNSCSANGTSSNLASGGGCYNSATLNLMNCTVSGNSVTGAHVSTRGGGITANAGTVTLGNTIVANNTNSSNANGPDFAGGFTSTIGHNLIRNTTSTFISGTTTGNQTGANPLLASLGNYGGPTQTLALLPGSPAINTGTNTGAPATDQRGSSRVGAVDIGAYESQGFMLSIVSGSPQSATVNTAFADPLKVAITPTNPGEPINGGTVSFTPPAMGASASVAGSPVTISSGMAQTGTVTANSVAGAYNVVAVVTGTSASVDFALTNNPGAAVNFLVTAPSTATAGSAFNFTVTARDAFGNTATGYSGTVRFASTDGAATLPANSTLTSGVGTFSATLKTAGIQTITATDTVSSSINGVSNNITVSAAAATRLTVSAPMSANVGVAFNFTVTAFDQFNNTATGYGGTVNFTSTDGFAVLPANNTLTNGVGTFSATLNTTGLKTITATDTVTSSITGTSGNINVTLATCPMSFTVNNTGDGVDANPGNGVCATAGSVCTLRAAIQEANALVSPTLCSPLTINITAIGTITLSSDLPTIAHPNLTINGPGANQLTVDGASLYRPFSIASGSISDVVTLAGLKVANGSANGGGGLLNQSTGTVNVNNMAFNSNAITLSSGGGAIRHASTGTLNVTGSTFVSNNSTGTGGGGINNFSTGTVNVTNCTFFDNRANLGGGIHTQSSGITNVTNCTLVANGGGIRNNSGTVTVKNSIVVGNGTDISGTVTQTTNLTGTLASALLGPLGNYGGTTDTYPLLPGSPALDAGTSTGAPANDQRGVTRGTVDIGAFEAQTFTLTVTGGTPQSTTVNTAFATALQVNLKEGANNLPGAVITFASPGSGASLNPVSGTATTDASGNASRSVTANTTAGAYTVTATTGALSQNFSLTNNPGAATNFLVTAPANATVGTAFNFTVTARDAFGNTATGYSGTVNFTSTDGFAVLPANSTLTNGTGTFSATLNSTGTKTITATDTASGSITGTSNNIVVSLATCPTTLTVNNTGDAVDVNPGNGVCATAGNVCTLRAAIQEANALTTCTPLTINFSVTGTIDLATALPDLNHPNLTINGPGASVLTVRRSVAVGTHSFRIFRVQSSKTVTINGLTLTNGQGTGGGGGLITLGTATLNNCVVTSNSADVGGGVAVSSGASLTITGSTISNNTTTSYGGGVFAFPNSLTMTDSVVSGNTSVDRGGGLYISNNPATLTNCTISGNMVTGNGQGGGVYFDGGASKTLTLTNCTLANNTGSAAAGLYNANSSSTSQYKNTIFANNGANIVNNGGTLTSLGSNLASDGTGSLTAAGDLPNTDALLAALGSYGGATQTHALLPGSPAINTGTPSGAPSADQRGVTRSTTDIGAFESQGFALALGSGANQSAVINRAFALPLKVTVTPNNAGEPVDGGQVVFTAPRSNASATIAGNPATIASGMATTGAVTANSSIGAYNVTASLAGAAGGASATRAAAGVNFPLANTCQPMTVTTPSVTTGTINVFFSQTFTQTGGFGAVAFSKTGALPAGLTLSSTGVLSGTPTQTGSFPLTVTATDGNNCPGMAPYTLVINPAVIGALSVSLSKLSPTDPLLCAGGVVNGSFAQSNSTPAAVSGKVYAVPQGLVATPGSVVCTLTPATGGATTFCNIENGLPTWRGTLAAGQRVDVTWQAQIPENPGAQVCSTAFAQFPDVTGAVQSSAPFCLNLNCSGAVGPGAIPDARSLVNDGKPGSVLIYNVYTSSATGANFAAAENLMAATQTTTTQNTRINLTNTSTTSAVFVHLFFVDGSTCAVADNYLCLTANQTASFLASDLDPGTTGYLIAVATDRTGCPIVFNHLIGDEYVKFASGHAANLAAEGVAAIPGGLPFCDTTADTAVLRFDGVSYNALPHVLAVDNVPSRADGNDTLLIVNRLGGSLVSGAATLGTVFGIFYDDAENALSFSFTAGTCQTRGSLSNNFPRIAPRFESFVPAGRSGWLKLYAPPTTPGGPLAGLSGAVINLNTNGGGNNFNQGHNLHKLTLTLNTVYTIPVFPPSC